ncbi:MAG: response regulator [Thermodesulfobacteriota bacterium]
MRALVIDDSSTIRQIIRQTLEKRLGFEVVEADSVGEAMDRIAWGGRYDLVVTDLLMPGLPGYSLIRRIRQEETGGEVPILVVSVEALDRKCLEEAAEAGASGFLAKPFRMGELERAVRSVLDAGEAHHRTQGTGTPVETAPSR